MSEQSGGGHITREQVERAIDACERGQGGIVIDVLGTPQVHWQQRVPSYVRDAWVEGGLLGCVAALTRWRDELAAAEPVRRVARWSEADGLYRLDPPHEYQIGDGDCRAYLVSRVQAIAWGYEIEGSPIRKVARWDATRGAYVALDAHGTVCMITTERAQAIDWGYDPEGGPEPVVDVPRRRRIMSVRSRAASAAMVRHTLPWLDDLARRLTGMAEHFARQAKHGGRAWESNALSETTCRDGVEAVTALRAMLAAIDAQQGGAS
jgi:hypothetical protein